MIWDDGPNVEAAMIEVVKLRAENERLRAALARIEAETRERCEHLRVARETVDRIASEAHASIRDDLWGLANTALDAIDRALSR